MTVTRKHDSSWLRRTLGAAILLGWLAGPTPSPAQPTVVFDGSLGEAGPAPTESLPDGGVDHRIAHTSGRQVDAALFHSFSELSVRAGDAATFTGPNTIDHVFARVTGGEASQIDGRLRSEIGSADLWLVNPQGVLFGAGARLEVDGSFHASTADELRFENGEAFEARAGGTVPTLVVAPPNAFGFLGGDPAPISVAGSELSVPAGEALSLVAGGIEITGGTLAAENGRVNLAAVASAGQVVLAPANAEEPLEMRGFGTLGEIRLQTRDGVGSLVDVSGSSPGSVFVRGGKFVVEGGAVPGEGRSLVRAENESTVPSPTNAPGPGLISVAASESVLVDNGLLSVLTDSEGNAGTIHVESPDVTFQNGTPLLAGEVRPTEVGAGAETTSSGAAGRIRIDARDLKVLNGADVSAHAGSRGGDVTGDGGTVEIVAHSVAVAGSAYIGVAALGGSSSSGTITIDLGDDGTLLVDGGYAWIVAGTYLGAKGDAGAIAIETGSLVVEHGGQIGVGTETAGDGGTIAIDADSVLLRTGGFINAVTEGASDAGSILIEAGSLVIESGGFITATTAGAGDAGSILVEAKSLVIESGGFINASSMESGTGNAGTIEIHASDSIRLTDEGGKRLSLLPIILQQPFSLTGIFSSTVGGGDGGSITLDSPDLLVTDGAIVATSTLGGGVGGTIALHGDRIRIANGALVDTTSLPGPTVRPGGAAGSIALVASESITVTGRGAFGDGARVSSATFTPGDAGAVSLSAPRVRIDDGGSVATTTLVTRIGPGGGSAGRIDVDAAQLVVGPGGQIDSSSLTTGAAGDLALRASESIAITGAGSRVATRAGARGAGGSIALAAPQITITDGGEISSESAPGFGSVGDIFASIVVAETFPGSGVTLVTAPPAAATGDGGSIEIATDALRMRSGSIAARAVGDADAGSIAIRAGERVELVDSAISTEAAAGAGGNIAIEAHDRLHLVRSAIAASVTSGSGGNVAIDPHVVVLEEGSRIVAQAVDGSGGNITLTADVLLVSPESLIDASSALGIHGTVAVNAPDTDLAGELAPLPVAFLDAVALMQERCSARRGGERAGSLVWTGRHGAPASPDGVAPAYYEASASVAARESAQVVGALLVERADREPIALLVGCG